ncbi:MAG: DegT/DnrJ/EryC1/StrS family aminotransferase, partial [Synergistaceae bacterium]
MVFLKMGKPVKQKRSNMKTILSFSTGGPKKMRNDFLPFAKPSVAEDAINDVVESIRSGWLAMGPKTIRFEENFSKYTGASWSLSV